MLNWCILNEEFVRNWWFCVDLLEVMLLNLNGIRLGFLVFGLKVVMIEWSG